MNAPADSHRAISRVAAVTSRADISRTAIRAMPVMILVFLKDFRQSRMTIFHSKRKENISWITTRDAAA